MYTSREPFLARTDISWLIKHLSYITDNHPKCLCLSLQFSDIWPNLVYTMKDRIRLISLLVDCASTSACLNQSSSVGSSSTVLNLCCLSSLVLNLFSWLRLRLRL